MRTRILAGIFLLFPWAPLCAQAGKTDLEKARLVEEAERNPAGALPLYRTAAENEKNDPRVRAEAWFRLGLCLERLGRKEEAEKAWKKAAAGQGPFAARAQARLKGGPRPAGDLLRQEVERLLKRLEADKATVWSEAAKELQWIGPPAVPYLVRALSEKPGSLEEVKRLVSVILKIGGKEAQAFLASARRNPDPLFRKSVARCFHSLPSTAGPALLSKTLEFLDDPDPGVRMEALSGLIDFFKFRHSLVSPPLFEKLLSATEDPSPEIRKEAFSFLLENFFFFRPRNSGVSGLPLRKLPARALRAFREKDPILEETTLDLAAEYSFPGKAFSWKEGNLLFLAMIASGRDLPRFLRIRDFSLGWTPPPEEILKAAKKLGPWSPSVRTVGGNKRVLSRYLTGCLPRWGKKAWPVVLDLARMGYAGEFPDSFASWIARKVPAEGLARFLEIEDLRTPLVKALPHLPPECLPVLEKVITKTIQEGGFHEGEEKILFLGIAGIRKREASDFLAALVEEHPEAYVPAAQALRERDLPQGIPARIRLLGLPGDPGQEKETAMERNRLFQNLVKKGVPGAEKAYARAYLQGLEKTGFVIPDPKNGVIHTPSLRGIQFLFLLADLEKKAPFSAYSSQEKAKILEACLAEGGPAPGWDLPYLIQRSEFPGFRRKAWLTLFSLSPEALEVIARRVPRLPDPGLRTKVLSIFTFALDPQAPAPPPFLHTLASEIVKSGEEGTIEKFLLFLTRSARNWRSRFPELVEPLLPFLKFRKSSLVSAILDFLSSYPEDRVLAAAKGLLESPDRDLRWKAVSFLGSTFGAKAGEALLPLLRDPDSQVRRAAAQALLSIGEPYLKDLVGLLKEKDPELVLVGLEACRERLAKEDVPALLEVLRRRSSRTRITAKAILEQIRFYFEQKAFWKKWLSGAGLGADPAEALVHQASPGKPKKIRLAAIASLATLGDPKALPFLIHLMEDQDPHIAAAAAKAVERINEKPGKAKKERK